MNTITISLPIPQRELSPNGRAHHFAKARVTKAAKRHARLLTLSALAGKPKPLHDRAMSHVHWFTRTVATPDGDNALASLKAYFDGIAEAGFLANDRGLSHSAVIFAKDASNPRVEITITANV